MSDTLELEPRQAQAAQSSTPAQSSSSVTTAVTTTATTTTTSPSSSSAASTTPQDAGNTASATASSSAASTIPQESGNTASATTKSSGLFSTSPVPSSSRLPSSTHSIASVPSSNAQHSGSHKQSYSGGALAGAIVGSIAGTFLLALLAFFLLRHRRKRNNPDAMAQNSVSVPTDSPKQPAQIQTRFFGTTAAPATGSQFFDLASYIPSAADDSTVATKIQTLFDQASLHVDNYYSHDNSTLRLTPDAVACMNKFESPFLASSLTTLLSNPMSRRAILTHALIRALLQGIQPGSPTWSLLPPCYAMSLNKQDTSGNDFDDHRAMFAWRMLTSSMYTRSHDPQGPDSRISQRDAIAALVEDFATAFTPYIDSHSTVEDHLAHLTSVVRAAADLGAWLFSQPCSFEFRWTSLATSSNQVITFPAVLKVGDEQGRLLPAPHTLVEATSAAI